MSKRTWSVALISLGLLFSLLLSFLTPQIVWARINVSNSAPTVIRTFPSSSTLGLLVGTSQTFMASVSDPDGNLERMIWSVDGRSQRDVNLSGSSAQDSFTFTFYTARTYEVEARAIDSQGAYEAVVWTVVVSGKVGTRVETNIHPSASVESGDKVMLWAKLFDASGNVLTNKTLKFYVAGAYAGQAETGGEWTQLNYTANLPAGNYYEVKVVFEGDSQYNSSFNTQALYVRNF